LGRVRGGKWERREGTNGVNEEKRDNRIECTLFLEELEEVSRYEVELDVLVRNNVGEGNGSKHVLRGPVVREGVEVGCNGMLIRGGGVLENEGGAEVHEVGD
jgi:hypothetical protein